MRTIAALGGVPLFNYPLHIVRPTFPKLDIFIESFRSALMTGAVTNNGPNVVEFERRLTEYIGVPTLVFSSGQAALMTMVRAAGIEDGEVIVPSLTFAATPHAVRWAGATPVFADSMNDGSMCIDPDDVERRITPRTKAILAMCAYGIACDYDRLDSIARRRNVRMLYDSAAAFGTTYRGRPVGGFGDAQIFSFHATKAFATMEGGCLSSNDPQLIERARVIRNFGQTIGGDCSEPGLNGKMAEICAMIGLEQLNTFDAAARTRKRAAKRMAERLVQIEGLEVGRAPAHQDPIWLYLPIVVDRVRFGLDRDCVAAALEQENIFVRKYYSPPCHKMTAYRGNAFVSLPVAERIAHNVLALPVYNDMTDAECDGIADAIQGVRRSVNELSGSPR